MNESIVKAVKEMIEAPSCCPELETAGEIWLESLGTDAQEAATKALIAEAKMDICTIDSVYNFFVSDEGKKAFGEEKANELAEHAKEVKAVKAAGGEYCDCGACAGAKFITEHESEMYN